MAGEKIREMVGVEYIDEGDGPHGQYKIKASLDIAIKNDVGQLAFEGNQQARIDAENQIKNMLVDKLRELLIPIK